MCLKLVRNIHKGILNYKIINIYIYTSVCVCFFFIFKFIRLVFTVLFFYILYLKTLYGFRVYGYAPLTLFVIRSHALSFAIYII